jgi:hypothetical protein
MPGKIFYRERLKVGEGEKKPRYIVVAIAGIDMKVYGQHLRKKELEQIARAVGAELVYMNNEEKEKGEEIGKTKKNIGKKRSS